MAAQPDYNDRTLIALAKAGNQPAIDQLARKYWPDAYRLAMRTLRSHEDAEEVAQDSVWEALRQLPTFRGDASFRTWLYRIVINRSLMALRRKRSRRFHLTVPLPAEMLPGCSKGQRTPEELLLEAECRTVLKEGISRLSPPYASVVQLAARENPSMIDIADRVGISAGAAKSRLHRGREQLRRYMNIRLTVPTGSGKQRIDLASMIAA